MSYIKSVGEAAEKEINEQKVDYSKVLKKFKSGSTYRVKLPTNKAFANYAAHGVFGKFYTTPCLGSEDLYCKASQYFYGLANKEKDEKKAEDLRQKAYELKAKERVLFGFFELETGQEIIIDVTKKQAQTFTQTINKVLKNADKFAFEVAKTGTGQSTTVSIMPVMDEDELSSTEKKNLEALKGKVFDVELFGKIFPVRDHNGQVEDITKYGLDVSVLGVSKEETPTENHEDVELNVKDALDFSMGEKDPSDIDFEVDFDL